MDDPLTGEKMSASMAIGAIVSNASEGARGIPPAIAQTRNSTPFGSLFQDAIGQMNGLESQARSAVTGLMTGSGVDVHQAVIATQKAEMAFELALSVRSKAMQAYQSVMGMQF